MHPQPCWPTRDACSKSGGRTCRQRGDGRPPNVRRARLPSGRLGRLGATYGWRAQRECVCGTAGCTYAHQITPKHQLKQPCGKPVCGVDTGQKHTPPPRRAQRASPRCNLRTLLRWCLVVSQVQGWRFTSGVTSRGQLRCQRAAQVSQLAAVAEVLQSLRMLK